MPMPALLASRRTVSTSQASSALRGFSITCTPIIRFAVHLEIARDTNAPPKPSTAPKTSSEVKLMPFASSQGSMPSRRSVTLATIRIAKLVARNSRILFIIAPSACGDPSACECGLPAIQGPPSAWPVFRLVAGLLVLLFVLFLVRARLRLRHAEAELEAALVRELFHPEDPAVLDHAEAPVSDRVAAEAADLAVAVAVDSGKRGLELHVETAARDLGEVGLAPAGRVQDEVAVVDRLEVADGRLKDTVAGARHLDALRSLVFLAELRFRTGTHATGDEQAGGGDEPECVHEVVPGGSCSLDRRSARRFRPSQRHLERLALVVVAVAVVLVIPVVVVFVFVEFVVILVLVVRARPAFRLIGQVEVELLPGLVVDLLHVAILVLQFDELRVLVDRQDLEHLFVVEAFIPLARYGIVIATHGSPQLFAPILRARADG